MTDMEKICFYDTPVGKLIIGEKSGSITRVTWTQLPKTYLQEETELILQCKNQLEEYFRGERKTFDLPLAPKGTEFQQKVWSSLQEIPYGEVRSYKHIAEKVGNATGLQENITHTAQICVIGARFFRVEHAVRCGGNNRRRT